MRYMKQTDFSLTLNGVGGDLALIRASGADAGSFLQGQLTQDVLLMPPGQARLAAWCSAKGRMLVSFVVWKSADQEFFLLLSRDLLAPTLKRLKMYVLRAKCELTDITAQSQVQGLVGDAIAQTLSGLPQSAINSEAIYAENPWACGQFGTEFLISLPPGSSLAPAAPPIRRALHIRTELASGQALPETAPQELSQWNALEVSSGIARLSAAVSEAFVPQMLNYESVGGVNFKKGCYPGQEVVARSQFRGTLKRRAYLVSCEAQMQAGQEVFDSREPGQACGMVAQAASSFLGGGSVAIISMQTVASDSPALHLGSPAGPRLHLQTLPYALLDDI